MIAKQVDQFDSIRFEQSIAMRDCAMGTQLNNLTNFSCFIGWDEKIINTLCEIP